MSLYLFPQDKANHFIYGAALGLTTLTLLSALKIPDTSGYTHSLAAVASATFLGVLKEVEDYFANQRAIAQGLPPQHGVEWMDMVATALGGVVVGFAHYL